MSFHRFREGHPRLLSLLGLLGLASIMALGVGFRVSAQDSTTADVDAHPAHIHNGSCADLDPNPLVPLSDVTVPLGGDDQDQPPASEDIQGAINQPLVEISKTESGDIDADVTFDELFEASHAINVHASAEDIQTYIACGDIGGVVVDDTVYVPLYSLNDSGYFGIAKIEKDGDKFNVEIYLAQPKEGGAAPSATPTS